MPSSRRKIEEEYVRPWKHGKYMFDIEAENARAAQNRHNEREAKGSQRETTTGSSELNAGIDDASQLQHLVTRKSDNLQPMMVGIGETSVHFLDLLMSPEFLQALVSISFQLGGYPEPNPKRLTPCVEPSHCLRH